LEVSYRPVELRSMIEGAQSGGRAVSLKDVMRSTPGGGRQYLDVEVRPLYDNDQAWMGASVVFQDITRYHQLQEDLESELMTPGLCRELMERYPREYDALRARVQSLSNRVKQLQTSVRELRASPLQDPRKYEQLVRELTETRELLEQVQPELKRLREMLQADREAVVVAKGHDEAYVRERLRWESLNPESLSQYLLGDEQTARIQSTLAWIRLVRGYIPTRREMEQPQRNGGRVLRFAGMQNAPDLLFERLSVDGQVGDDVRAVPFSGMLCDVTHQPAVLGRPATFSIETNGATPLQIQGTVDRTGTVAHDRIVVTCPTFQQPQRQLGRDDALAVCVAPGRGSLRMEIELRDDELSGQLVLQQTDLDMSASLAGAYGGAQLESRLNQTLDAVPQFQVAVHLSGTLRRPRGRLESDLGSHLSEGFQTAFRQELDARADQIVSRLDHEVQQQLDRLQHTLDNQSEQLLARLEGPRRELEQLIAPATERLGISPQIQLPSVPKMGKLPVRNWFPR
ncbi:MAG: hypothetical protein JJ992_28570, partial [Planctomycetes bacterium]|nr:hypothetical protein [Planctomycetota bacterium]